MAEWADDEPAPHLSRIPIEESDDTRALVLELVEGPTLAERIAKGPIPVDDALPIAKQIAEALEAAHEAGVIHRDLKPANIKVREDGTVKVLDFDEGVVCCRPPRRVEHGASTFSLVRRSAMRHVKSALIVVAVVCLPIVLGLRAAGVPPGLGPIAGEASAQTGSEREKLVGTYQLVGREVKDADGTWRPTSNFNSIGYITYSDTGYMGVHVMPNDRAPFAGDQPTAEEAQTALQGYTAYYGPFSTDEDEDGMFVVHHRVGQIDPGGEVDAKRFYDFEGDRLILTPAAADGSKQRVTRHVLWERLPDVPLSDEARRFVGFRQLLYTDRYTERDGRLVTHGQRNERRAGSYIIYTPTGHMMVHLTAREERTPYAGATPTPDEALAAYRSYGGYFGRFTVHEDDDPPYVVHHQEGRPRPSPPTDADRLYQLDGDVLRLGVRPRMSDGETTGGHLYWEMLPARPE